MVGEKIYSLLIYRLLENAFCSPYLDMIWSFVPSLNVALSINFSQKSPPWKAFLVALFEEKMPPYLREEHNIVNKGLNKNLSNL